MTYEVSLNNRSAMFDTGNFETLEEALKFSRNRGGIYSVNISSGSPWKDSFHTIHLSFDSSTGKFSHDTMMGWVEIDNENLLSYVNQYV